MYFGERVLDKFIDFARGGYNETRGILLKGPQTFFQKIWTMSAEVIDAFALMMDEFGLSSLPYWLKVLMPLGVLMSPVIGIILCIILIPDQSVKAQAETQPGKTEEETRIAKQREEQKTDAVKKDKTE